MKNTNSTKIVLVENPLRGKNINVYLILAFWDSQKYTNSSIGGTEGYDTIDWVIRILSTNFLPRYRRFKNSRVPSSIKSLYRLREAFLKYERALS